VGAVPALLLLVLLVLPVQRVLLVLLVRLVRLALPALRVQPVQLVQPVLLALAGLHRAGRMEGRPKVSLPARRPRSGSRPSTEWPSPPARAGAVLQLRVVRLALPVRLVHLVMLRSRGAGSPAALPPPPPRGWAQCGPRRASAPPPAPQRLVPPGLAPRRLCTRGRSRR
jgi:hypothetical protein